MACCGAWQRTGYERREGYALAQDELVEARNRLARAIAGAAMSGLTQAEIVDLTDYPADRVLRICTRRRRQRGMSRTSPGRDAADRKLRRTIRPDPLRLGYVRCFRDAAAD